MAADQRRKLLNGASIVGCSSKEQHRMRKKKLGSPQNDLHTKSHISLDWDGNQKKVIAKREQIGISCRDLRPFIDSIPHCQNILADVFLVPLETFELENLTEVLSYEAWQTCLSENERNFLTQFLPRGTNAQQVVQALLAGDNFHFGNPFLKWGTALCSCNLHPDVVLRQEQCFKADKRAYYSELQKYHYDILGYLQKLKEKWESCKDPGEEIVQKIWSRSRQDMGKKIPSRANESRFQDIELDITATSESCSWIEDEKACSSDNQNSSVLKREKLQKRIYEKDFVKDKYRNALTASDGVLNVGAPGKGVKIQMHNFRQNDGARYMSYLKISKKQHQLVTSMKQSGKSIQSRSLNRVLGDLDSLHVQPYEVFVEEEQKKLHKYWLRLANEDLPSAYASWREIKLQKREMTKSLENDMKDKLNFQDEGKENPETVLQDRDNINSFLDVDDDGKENPETVVQDQKDSISTHHEYYMQDHGDSVPGSLQDPETVLRHQDNVGSYLGVEYEGKENPESVVQEHKDIISTGHESNMEDDRDSVPGSLENQSLLQLTSPSGGHEFKLNGTDSVDNHCLSKSDDASSDISEHSGKLNAADIAISQGVPLSSGGDMWPAVSMPHSYYDSTVSREYTSISGLALAHPQVNEEQQTHLIDLESDLHEEDTRKFFFHRQSNDGSFSSFPNQDRTELLQSLFKGQGMLSYNPEQKRPRLDFQPLNNVLMGDGQFSGHFQEQLQPLEQGQKRQNEVYLQQNVSENIYSDVGRYLIPRQECFPPGSVQNWNVSSVCMSAPLQSQLNSGQLLNQNWFSGEHHVRSGWAGSDGVSVPSEGIGSGSNGDQSLFGVLSHCSQLRSGGPFDSVGSSEQFIAPRNYGMVGGSTSGISNGLPQEPHPLDYLGGSDPTTSLMPDEMGWMNMPHQNSALHDPMGKPYLRSWNQ